LFIWYIDVDSAQWVEVSAGYANNLSATTDIIPAADNTYGLGNASYRWKAIYLGPGTLYITDQTLLTDAAITVNNGVFNIGGIVQAQLPHIKLTDITFSDNTVQTSAPGIPVAYTPSWTGTGLVHSGTPATGSYMKVNKLVTFRASVVCTTTTNFGTGQYSLTLPFVAADGSGIEGDLLIGTTRYPIRGLTTAGSTQVTLWNSNGPNAAFEALTHNSTGNFATTTTFRIYGTYEAQ
jgi:hypothetical protein